MKLIFEADAETKKKVRRELYIIFCLMGILYAGIIYGLVTRFREDSNTAWVLIEFSLNLLAIPVIGLLMYYRKRWGWILAFAYSLLMLGDIALLLRYGIDYGMKQLCSDITSYRSLFYIIIGITWLAFLCRNSMSLYFGLTKVQRRKYMIRAIIVSGTLVIYIFYSNLS